MTPHDRFSVPNKIRLYKNENYQLVNYDELLKFIKETFKHGSIEIHDSIFSEVKDIDAVAFKLAQIRILSIDRYHENLEPLDVEINVERDFLRNIKSKMQDSKSMIPLEGYKFASILRELIDEKYLNINILNLVFTDRLVLTYDLNDLRYHARMLILGAPTIISIPGIVEAPAKPREYYLMKQTGIDYELLRKNFNDKIIDYDWRITEVCKSLVIQSYHWHLSGNAFCDNDECRLYNSHTQENLLKALVYGKICEKCQQYLNVRSN